MAKLYTIDFINSNGSKLPVFVDRLVDSRWQPAINTLNLIFVTTSKLVAVRYKTILEKDNSSEKYEIREVSLKTAGAGMEMNYNE